MLGHNCSAVFASNLLSQEMCWPQEDKSLRPPADFSLPASTNFLCQISTFEIFLVLSKRRSISEFPSTRNHQAGWCEKRERTPQRNKVAHSSKHLSKASGFSPWNGTNACLMLTATDPPSWLPPPPVRSKQARNQTCDTSRKRFHWPNRGDFLNQDFFSDNSTRLAPQGMPGNKLIQVNVGTLFPGES